MSPGVIYLVSRLVDVTTVVLVIESLSNYIGAILARVEMDEKSLAVLSNVSATVTGESEDTLHLELGIRGVVSPCLE